MGAVNKAIIIGNLGADPEVRFTPTQTAVCNLRVATNEQWTDKNGQRQERTEWHRIVVWGKLAENCGKYLQKGRQCYVEGRLQTREWTDKEGKKNYTTEIVATNVVFLGSKGEGASAGANGNGRRSSPSPQEEYGAPPPELEQPHAAGPANEDDIPF